MIIVRDTTAIQLTDLVFGCNDIAATYTVIHQSTREKRDPNVLHAIIPVRLAVVGPC